MMTNSAAASSRISPELSEPDDRGGLDVAGVKEAQDYAHLQRAVLGAQHFEAPRSCCWWVLFYHVTFRLAGVMLGHILPFKQVDEIRV